MEVQGPTLLVMPAVSPTLKLALFAPVGPGSTTGSWRGASRSRPTRATGLRTSAVLASRAFISLSQIIRAPASCSTRSTYACNSGRDDSGDSPAHGDTLSGCERTSGCDVTDSGLQAGCQ
jgi:hypothetical protein